MIEIIPRDALELFPCDGTGCGREGPDHARDCARGILEWFLQELAKPRAERETYHGVPLADEPPLGESRRASARVTATDLFVLGEVVRVRNFATLAPWTHPFTVERVDRGSLELLSVGKGPWKGRFMAGQTVGIGKLRFRVKSHTPTTTVERITLEPRDFDLEDQGRDMIRRCVRRWVEEEKFDLEAEIRKDFVAADEDPVPRLNLEMVDGLIRLWRLRRDAAQLGQDRWTYEIARANVDAFQTVRVNHGLSPLEDSR